MVGVIRKIVAVHEAGHAVVARLLGAEVAAVSARSIYTAVSTTQSLAYRHRHDAAAHLLGLEDDAKIALAGPYAQQRAYPGTIDDIDDQNIDAFNATSAIMLIVWIKAGKSPPVENSRIEVVLTSAEQNEAEAIYLRLAEETVAMVEEHWRKIERVAKALERHDQIDQAELDRLIAVADMRS
jgi:hypothetical protein